MATFLRELQAIGLAALLTCAAAARAESPPRQVSSIPPATALQTAYAPSELLRSEFAVVTPGARPLTAVHKQVFIEVYDVAAYEPLQQVPSKSAFKACTGQLGVCLFDDDGDGKFDRIAKDSLSRGYKLDQPLSYERRDVVQPGTSSRRLIRLEGIWGRTVSLSYRETNDLPSGESGSETCSIPIPDTLPVILSVRDYRILVEAITPKSLTYRILPLAGQAQPPEIMLPKTVLRC